MTNKRATDLYFIVAPVKILYPRDDTSLSSKINYRNCMNLNYEINGSTYCPIGLYLPL